MSNDKKQKAISKIISTIFDGTVEERRAYFEFDNNSSEEEVLLKWNLWQRYYFPHDRKDADHHREMDLYYLRAYSFNEDPDDEDIKYLINLAYRGAGKTTRLKKFVVFCIANDLDHYRRYIKVLAKSLKNSTQFVTDVYNYLVRISYEYPEVLNSKTKEQEKQQRRMGDFVTDTGIKVQAATVGMDARGDVFDDSRPDFQIYDDFETEMTLQSIVETSTIRKNMEESRTGLSKTGSAVYLANYKSERGNVHELVTRNMGNKKVFIVPIATKIKFNKEGEIESCVPAWNSYTVKEIENIRKDALDFAGEYLQNPALGNDTYFPRAKLRKQVVKDPIREVNGLKIFKEYDPKKVYALGADVAKGVGKDSSTSVIIDMQSFPREVVATYRNNLIKPSEFGNELVFHGKQFGNALLAPENNIEEGVIVEIKRKNYPNVYYQKSKGFDEDQKEKRIYGWNTNRYSKSMMLQDLYIAIQNDLLIINDHELIVELEMYSKNDLMDRPEIDPRIATRHFDLLMACFVKGTLVLTEKGQLPIEKIKVGDKVMTRKGLKKVISTFNRTKEITNNIGLTGTHDHPVICNDNEVKELSKVSNSDILYIWNNGNIDRLSYTEVQNITDTQTQNTETIEPITWEGQNGRSLENTYIARYGKIILEKFRKVLLFITKTAIQVTITLVTLLSLAGKNTKLFICKILKQRQCLGKTSKLTEKKLTKGSEKQLKKGFLSSFIALYVKNNLKLLLIMQSFVQKTALINLTTKEKENNHLVRLVIYAKKNLSQVFQTKKDVRENVINSEEEKIIARVYNIEVEEAHEYFANNILVHNCAIAWQMRNEVQLITDTEPGLDPIYGEQSSELTDDYFDPYE